MSHTVQDIGSDVELDVGEVAAQVEFSEPKQELIPVVDVGRVVVAVVVGLDPSPLRVR